MKGRLAGLLLVLLAGCAAPSPRDATVVPLDAPPLASILPHETDLPPGFHLGFEPRPTAERDATTLSRVYDYAGNNATVRHTLLLGATRFSSLAKARETCQSVLADPSPDVAPAVEVAPGVFVRDARSDQGRAETVNVVGCKGIYLAWVAEGATGEPALADGTGLVEAMLARVPDDASAQV